MLWVLYWQRAFFVRPAIAWLMLNLSLLFMGLSMTDTDFAALVTKPDNVPIVGLLFLLGYFTWLATYRAVQNDQRRREGLPPLEAEDSEKVLVWPDLVYTELICMIALTALLVVWGVALQAPLEEPASSVKTPNPSKAPWYFLGLQEMLVYYDPWMAGVVLPSLVVFGLMAIPYIDFNKNSFECFELENKVQQSLEKEADKIEQEAKKKVIQKLENSLSNIQDELNKISQVRGHVARSVAQIGII